MAKVKVNSMPTTPYNGAQSIYYYYCYYYYYYVR